VGGSDPSVSTSVSATADRKQTDPPPRAVLNSTDLLSLRQSLVVYISAVLWLTVLFSRPHKVGHTPTITNTIAIFSRPTPFLCALLHKEYCHCLHPSFLLSPIPGLAAVMKRTITLNSFSDVCDEDSYLHVSLNRYTVTYGAPLSLPPMVYRG